MMKKSVVCPNCGVILEVVNSKNEAVKQIFCPNCKIDLQVRFDSPPKQPLDAHTYYAPKSQKDRDNNGETQLSRSKAGATILAPAPSKNISAKLVFKGVDYPLQMGRNVIGRKATTSQASIQIATTDRYMSRQHAVIHVSTLPDGTLKATFQNYQNKNDTTIDGQPIETGDEIRLVDGNSITMGYTSIIFKAT